MRMIKETGTTIKMQKKIKKNKEKITALIKFNEPVYVTKATEETLYFSNGFILDSEHYEECCEWNHIDFNAAIDDEVKNNSFTKIRVKVKNEFVVIKFYDLPHKKLGTYNKKIAAPCYSDQSGYYSCRVCLVARGKYSYTGVTLFQDIECDVRE